MVFLAMSDTNQKKIFKAFFVVWSVAEHYKKQDLFPHKLTFFFYFVDYRNDNQIHCFGFFPANKFLLTKLL